MRHWWKLIVLGMLLFIGGQTSHPEVAYACSGDGTVRFEYLIESDIIVYGIFVDVDDAHQNGRFLVEEYWKGSGPSELIISQNTTRRVHYLRERNYGGDCDGFDTWLRTGEHRVLFLHRNFDGSYGTSTSLYNERYSFPSPDSIVRSDIWSAETETIISFNFTDFRDLVTESAGSTVQLPDYELSLARQSPIVIHTENDSLYLLPIDNDEPILLANDVTHWYVGQEKIVWATTDGFYLLLRQDNRIFRTPLDGEVQTILSRPDFTQCEYDSCFAFAPNYDYVAFFQDENTIRVCIDITLCDDNEYSEQATTTVEGRAFQFSPSGRLMAIWQDEQINIYELRIPNREEFFVPTDPMITIPANLTPETIGKGAWSPDSSWFVFSDEDGMWRTDILQPETEPELLIPPNEGQIPVADKFSDIGRYIYITQGDERFIFDTRRSELLPDGIVFPDETFIVEIDDININHVIMEGNRAKVFWSQNGAIYFMDRYSDSDDVPYSLVNGYILGEDWLFISGEDYMGMDYNGVDFDFEPISETFLIQNDGTRITIGRLQLDLAEYLDGDIRTVEWLPAIYFEE